MRFEQQKAFDLAEEAEVAGDRLPFVYAAVGALIGAGLGALLLVPAGKVSLKAHLFACGMCLLGGAALGFLVGQVSGLRLRLQAMSTLGQVQIERNTRKEKSASTEPAPTSGSNVPRREPPQMTKTLLSRPPAHKAAP